MKIAPGMLFTDGDILYEIKGNDGQVVQYRELWPDGEEICRFCSTIAWMIDVKNGDLKEVPGWKLDKLEQSQESM